MKRVGIIGSGTSMKGFLHPIKEHEVTIIDNERKVDENTTEVVYFSPAPRIEISQYFAPKIKGRQRPYKFHK